MLFLLYSYVLIIMILQLLPKKRSSVFQILISVNKVRTMNYLSKYIDTSVNAMPEADIASVFICHKPLLLYTWN